MKTLTTSIARIIFAIPFIVFGVFHLMNAQGMSGMVPGFVPGAVFWVYFTGVAMIAAGVSFVINRYAKLAGLLLAVLLLIYVVTIHVPGVIDGSQQAMSSLLKDVALTGGALLVSGISKD
jgi:uncharacterized membrane protein YphA (DoxX/SURF4 family)